MHPCSYLHIFSCHLSLTTVWQPNLASAAETWPRPYLRTVVSSNSNHATNAYLSSSMSRWASIPPSWPPVSRLQNGAAIDASCPVRWDYRWALNTKSHLRLDDAHNCILQYSPTSFPVVEEKKVFAAGIYQHNLTDMSHLLPLDDWLVKQDSSG